MQEMQGWNTARLPAFHYIGKVSLVKIIYFIRSNNVAGGKKRWIYRYKMPFLDLEK